MADDPNPGADLAALTAAMPFAVAIGMELRRADADEVVGTMAWSAERCTAGGVLHGGALMALADSVGALCAFFGLPQGASTATITSSTCLFRAVSEGEVTATARPLHRGRRMVVVQTDLVDASGRPVAQVTQAQAVLT